jgi:hypothetical protein
MTDRPRGSLHGTVTKGTSPGRNTEPRSRRVVVLTHASGVLGSADEGEGPRITPEKPHARFSPKGD